MRNAISVENSADDSSSPGAQQRGDPGALRLFHVVRNDEKAKTPNQGVTQ